MNNLITRNGYETLVNDLHIMASTDRMKIASEIETARGFGDLSENAEYQYAKEKQALLEKKIAELSEYLSNCEIVDISNILADRVLFGTCVKVLNLDTDEEKTFTLVGEREFDVKNGKISYKSPIAQALLGRSKGDDIEFMTHIGEHYYEIIDIIT